MRILLLETLNAERLRHHRAEFLPFVLDWVCRSGHEGRWWVVAVPEEQMHAGARYVVGRWARDEALLLTELERDRPDVILMHDQPSEGLRRLLAEAAPGARVVDLSMKLHALLSVGELGAAVLGRAEEPRRGDHRAPSAPSAAGTASSWSAPAGQRLLDAVGPRFERRLLGLDAAEVAARPWRLAGGIGCAYRRRVRDNPFYAGMASEIVARHRGCAFCDKGTWDPDNQPGLLPQTTAPVDLALAQIEAHQAAAAELPDVHFEYVAEDGELLARLPALFAALLERRARPLTFYAMLRADQLLGMRRELDALLRRLAELEHRLHLVSVGAESFSAEENERLNKGLTSEQLWACHDLMRGYEARFPGTFACIHCLKTSI